MHADVEVVGSTPVIRSVQQLLYTRVAVSSELSRATVRNLGLVIRWKAEACETLHFVDNKTNGDPAPKAIAHAGAQRS
jgi:hypothetical protein